MTICISITETDYNDSMRLRALRQAHEVDLTVVEEKCYDDGEYVFEVEVTGANAGVFAELYDAVFS